MHPISKKIIVIGGGAAGFFAAINIKLNQPEFEVTILEKTNKLLSKVRISGGGRCNVTHHCFENSELVKNYPRGNKELAQVFSRFNVQSTIAWFKENDVTLKTEEDGRMFPYSDSSETIVNCFLDLAKRLKIKINLQQEVFAIHKRGLEFEIKTNQGVLDADNIVCASGGNNKLGAYDFLKNLGHTIDSPIPSLFTFNMPNEDIRKELQGVSVKQAGITIHGTSLKYAGPLLITHWGLSGPAVLKLSAFAAKEFFDLNYVATVKVNWLHPLKREEIETELKSYQKEKHKSLPFTNTFSGLPKRLWEHLCIASEINNSKPWAEIGKTQLMKLAGNIFESKYAMQGKTTFKEEFVTCGGVNLKEINFKTMESKKIPGVYFCGEVLNIDGITGGFNFQSAWSTAWICASAISS